MNAEDSIEIIKEHIPTVKNKTVEEALHRAITALEKEKNIHKHG